jgi:hypothetical protein
MKSPLCPYKYIFGKPGEGIHSYRLFDLAIMDIVGTALGALFFAWYFKWNVWITLLLFFISGIVAHRLFCVRTTVDKILFVE